MEDAEHERTEVVALACGESAQYERFRVEDLVLHPVRSATRFIEASRTFADDAFEALKARGFVERGAIAKVFGVPNQIARRKNFLKQFLPLDEWDAAQV